MILEGVLEGLALPSAVKTSGKRGLHLVVPLAPGPSHDGAFAFASRIAEAVSKVMPDVATIERQVEKRRAVDGAPVSTPLRWNEVAPEVPPSAYTLRTVPSRVARYGDLFADALSAKGRLSPGLVAREPETFPPLPRRVERERSTEEPLGDASIASHHDSFVCELPMRVKARMTVQ